MKRRVWGLALLLSAAGLGAEGDGGQPAAWSKLSLGARSAALGQAVNALAGDPNAALLNPALAASLDDARIGSQAAFLPDGRQWHHLGLSRPFGSGSAYAWSLGYAQYTVDQPLERRVGNSGVPDSFFKESASLTQLGLAAWVLERRLAVGLGVKVLSHALGDASGGGAAADFGLLWRSLPWLDLGLAVRDAGSRLGWSNGSTETLLARLRLAAHLRPWGGRLGLLLEGDASQEQALRLRAGLEAWPWPERLALRAGLDGAQPAAGLGLRWPWSRAEAALDYALVVDPLGGAALQHRFSLEIGIPL
jgi:hypothetical protein